MVFNLGSVLTNNSTQWGPMSEIPRSGHQASDHEDSADQNRVDYSPGMNLLHRPPPTASDGKPLYDKDTFSKSQNAGPEPGRHARFVVGGPTLGDQELPWNVRHSLHGYDQALWKDFREGRRTKAARNIRLVALKQLGGPRTFLGKEYLRHVKTMIDFNRDLARAEKEMENTALGSARPGYSESIKKIVRQEVDKFHQENVDSLIVGRKMQDPSGSGLREKIDCRIRLAQVSFPFRWIAEKILC